MVEIRSARGKPLVEGSCLRTEFCRGSVAAMRIGVLGPVEAWEDGRELVFEHGSYESIIEEARRAVDDMQRLGLRIVGPDSARRTEHGAVR